MSIITSFINKKNLLNLFIVMTIITTFVALIAVLQNNFSQEQIQILLTCAVITFMSLCALSCINFLEKNSQALIVKIGAYTGCIISTLSTISTICAIWLEISEDEYIKAVIILLIISYSIAHVFALLSFKLSTSAKPILFFVASTFFLFALYTSQMIIYESSNEGSFKILIIFCILIALFTVLIPVLAKKDKLSSNAIQDKNVTSTTNIIKQNNDNAKSTQAQEIDSAFLKAHSLFGGLSDIQIDDIKKLLALSKYAVDSEIISEGSTNSQIFFILKGSVQVSKKGRTVAIVRAGETFGEMEFLDIMYAAATVKALEEVETASYTRSALHEIYKQNPDAFSLIMMNLARDLSRRLRAMDEKLS